MKSSPPSAPAAWARFIARAIRGLGAIVAIKVLPAGLSSDPDRLARFEQEARAAAALNHPNILAVFDIGEYASSPYVVSEVLEGETLRERDQRGAVGQEGDRVRDAAADLESVDDRAELDGWSQEIARRLVMN
jgi:serine/threonine protein kinase